MYSELVNILLHGSSRTLVRLNGYNVALACHDRSLNDYTLGLECQDGGMRIHIQQTHDDCSYLLADIVYCSSREEIICNSVSDGFPCLLVHDEYNCRPCYLPVQHLLQLVMVNLAAGLHTLCIPHVILAKALLPKRVQQILMTLICKYKNSLVCVYSRNNVLLLSAYIQHLYLLRTDLHHVCKIAKPTEHILVLVHNHNPPLVVRPIFYIAYLLYYFIDLLYTQREANRHFFDCHQLTTFSL